MAVHKVIRTNPPAQPMPQQATAKPERPHAKHQVKAELFEILHHLNRGYGVVVAALEKLETKARQQKRRMFPTGFLNGYRNRTEALRAETNRDLLRMIAEYEGRDASRFATPLTAKDAKHAKA
jgi:hypothetical protein